MVNLHRCGTINLSPNWGSVDLNDNKIKPGSGDHSKFWPQHKTLKIAFTKHSEIIKDTFETAIQPWLPHINLSIEFVTNIESADIRVSYGPYGFGNGAYIGTDALLVAAHLPTMLFDTSYDHDEDYPRDYWKALILHEFGHALGLEHEHQHQHPDHTIDWNTAAIYRNCKEKKGWSEATTYRNIFQKNRRQNTKDLPYDPTSIMHSAISETFIWNKIAMPLNSTLSEKDINLIKSIYPK